MATAGNGDDKRTPSGQQPAARPAVPTPGKVVVRTGESGAGESRMMGAADTAVAMNSHTEPEIAPPVPPDEDMLVGTNLLGRYIVTKKIGQGGMGAVYEATHALIGKRVAIKVLLDKYAKKDQIVARLEQEARLASAIGHEHIIDITDFGQTSDGRTFVVMEFLDGESLAECLAREGKLPESRILLIAQQVASALGAAHAKGIVHRDVKPENVFLLKRKDKDFVKVVDFGISKNLRATNEGGADSPRLTQTGMVLGTPLYMSPEQARGDEELDARIDIYALGVIMYELATGTVPFSGTNYLSVISQVLNDEPKRPREIRPELSEEFEAVVLRALEKDRDKRYQSVEEILADINALLDDPMRSTQRPRITAPRRLRPRGGATRVLAWVVGVAVIIAAVAVTVSFTMGGKSKAPAAAADAGRTAAVVVDAGAAKPAAVIDGASASPEIEIWITTQPAHATVYDNANGRVFRTPFPLKIATDAAPLTLETDLDGYESLTFTVDPQTDADHPDQKHALVEKLAKKKAGSTGNGRPHGNDTPPHDTGSDTPPPPKNPDHCPGDVKPNPITHKCPEG